MAVLVLILALATPVAFAQSPPAGPVSGWTIYRNEKMGFEARHPPGWHVNALRGTATENVLLGEPPQAGKPRLAVQFWVQRGINPRGLGIAEWYADQLSRMRPESAKGMSVTNVVVGGRPAVRRDAVGSMSYHVDFFVALKGTDVFEITILQPIEQTQLDPTIDQLLATVTFID
jgi:hypothetical protein